MALLLKITRILLPIAALLMIAPELHSTLIGACFLGAVTLSQIVSRRPAAAVLSLSEVGPH